METSLEKSQTSVMTVKSVLQQVELIQELLNSVMKENEHFGVIQGCGNKPCLLKAGAEKICFTFRLSPSFEIQEKEYPNYHREYRVVTTLRHIESGNIVGSGVGVGSTLESKWRFRNDTQDTGQPIPQDYRQNKGKYKEQGLGAVKFGDSWKWCSIKKLEHDNPADMYNTVLKMAKKRSQVDAVLTATACSDIFAQDLEEIGDQVTKVVAKEVAKESTKAPIAPTVVDESKQNKTRDQLIAEIKPLVEKHKASKLKQVADAVGIEWDQFDAWTEASGEKLVSMLSLLKC